MSENAVCISEFSPEETIVALPIVTSKVFRLLVFDIEG